MTRPSTLVALALAAALVATAQARPIQKARPIQRACPIQKGWQTQEAGTEQEPEMEPRVEFEAFAFPAMAKELSEQGGAWNAFFENGTMQCGVYRIPAGGEDGQRPHAEDEVYYVVAGRSKFTAGEETVAVVPGAVYFVAAEVEHRFHDVEEDLEVLVFFSKAPIEKKG